MDTPISTSVRRDNLSAISVCLAAMALITAMVAVGFSASAIGENSTDVAVAAVAAGAKAAPVTATADLSEFKIQAVSVAVGGSVHVTNVGSTTHNLVVQGTDVATEDLAPGASQHL